MPDRTDLDALLIGALYGELTPADEARLAAHLESHPADRTALADLTRTRAAVRDSRILAFQAEPPSAISALLLQEASRRAPRPESETASWFHRFVRSFMAHPAMAAAAMIVLVASVTGTLFLRGSDQFAASRPPAASVPTVDQPTAGSEATVTAGPVAPAAAPAAAPEPAPPPQAQPTGAASGAAAKGDGYGVGLDDTVSRDGLAQKPAAEKAKNEDERRLAKDAEPQAVAHGKMGKKPASIEVRTPSPRIEPKELGDSDDLAPPKTARRENAGRASPRDQAANGYGGGAGGAAPAPTSPPAAMTVPDQASQAASEPSAPSDKKAAPRVTRGGSLAPAKPVAPAPSNATANAAGSAANSNAPSVLDWARKQKEQVVALVSANKCFDAASVAGEIYSRAPDYYAANIANDRSIKPCLTYLEGERKRQDRAKAANRANQADEPARVDK